jgi:1,4-dihydroxy-2-naphthoate octaprenyltransferase
MFDVAERRGTASEMLRGIWRLADPKISLASVSSMLLGAGAAASLGPLDPTWLTVTVLGIFFIEVGKNASGEIFDFAADAAVQEVDRSPFSGGKRVLIDGLLTPRQTGIVAGAGFVGGIGLGLWIAVAREPRVAVLGAVGVACAWFYNAAPIRLAYRGLGEAAVALCYGPLIFAGTVIVQRHEVPWALVSVSLPLGLLIAAFLWVCELPDCAADRSVGKHTLVARLGRRRAGRLYAAIVVAAAGMVAALPALGAPRGAWLGLVFLVPSVAAASILWRRSESTTRIIAAQKLALVSFLAYAAGAGAGLLFLN